ncbi:c-type cytochrome [Paracraurococcus lichenis]|uniref:Cytochrome c n=1 Tax=Paracraurococcus lichenis TaxID=3064888 RepID=A0ABT9DXY6_9PROT|nr:cytochrome c [Paracraurococcus sp. LOR1-02]MDO9708767.1 cytochrome c [Paracraurococcus sp. LOR1-02]
MRAGLLLLLPLALAACKQEMAQQRKYGTYAAAPLWPDGTAARPLPVGVVAQGALARDRTATEPPEVTPALLARGQERYGIYCAPCHGPAGDGDGMIPRRGFPHPPSYHSDRLRAAPAAYIFDVITRGYGVMYGYAARVEPADRWAIIAYIRALQLSQRVALAEVPDARERLP